MRCHTEDLKRGEKAQSTVELALIMPVLVFFLLGIMEGGRIFAGYVELQNAARDGARYAAIHCTEKKVPDGQVSFWVQQSLTPWVQKRLTMLNPALLEVALLRTRSSDGDDVWIQVTLRYPLQIVTPVIGSLTGNPFVLEVTMAMRTE